MQLPGAERALADAVKVRDYLLSFDHPVGRAKARFFSAIGFTRAAWPALHRVLLDLAIRGDAIAGKTSEHGQKYEIHDIIRGPTGREAHIVTVWIILNGEDFPRLVTAHPGDAP